jgi:hypothetical protein
MPICTVCVKSFFVRPSLWAAAFGAALVGAVPLTHEPAKFSLLKAVLVLSNKLNCFPVNQRTHLEDKERVALPAPYGKGQAMTGPHLPACGQ